MMTDSAVNHEIVTAVKQVADAETEPTISTLTAILIAINIEINLLVLFINTLLNITLQLYYYIGNLFNSYNL